MSPSKKQRIVEGDYLLPTRPRPWGDPQCFSRRPPLGVLCKCPAVPEKEVVPAFYVDMCWGSPVWATAPTHWKGIWKQWWCFGGATFGYCWGETTFLEEDPTFLQRCLPCWVWTHSWTTPCKTYCSATFCTICSQGSVRFPHASIETDLLVPCWDQHTKFSRSCSSFAGIMPSTLLGRSRYARKYGCGDF